MHAGGGWCPVCTHIAQECHIMTRSPLRWLQAVLPCSAVRDWWKQSVAFLRWFFSPSESRLFPRNRYLPLLEGMEERAVPAVYYWVGPAGGSAGVGANWEE